MLEQFLLENKIDCLLVNSTNEFLVEYNTLEENSRYHLTGFSGSTGDALVVNDKIYLFVDGRYHIQADNEVDLSKITVVKLKTGQTFIDEISKKVPHNATVGIVAKKNSQARVEMFQKHFKVKLLDTDPFEKNITKSSTIQNIDINFTGLSKDEKIRKIQSKLQENEAFLFTNLEEISYLFNLRDFSKPYAANILGKAFVSKNNATLFTPENQDLYQTIDAFNGRIYVDKNSTNAKDYAYLGEKASPLKTAPLQLMKAVKTEAELMHYKEAFKRTDAAVFAIRNYIENNDNISEYDIAKQLEKEFKNFGAKSLSFKSIVAKDKNSALAHYSKCSKDEIIQDGSLILIDCGAYYEGGLATDITRVFVKGTPTDLQKKVYTTVLKTFLHAFNYPIKQGICGYEIDNCAREIFAQNPIDGFEFNHGLGHGIGISVHESPPNLSKNEIAYTELQENMCFTIEPGLYNKEHFGVRLENSCYLKNGKINSFVNMCYEEKLINYDMLSTQELEWLGKFEVR